MAGEAVRPVANFPDDFQVVTTAVPLVGTGSALALKIPLWALDDDIVVDSVWVTVPGTTTLNVALGTATTAAFFVAPPTDKVQAGIAGNSVALATSLDIAGGANDTAAARKPAVINTSNNRVPAGSVVAVVYTTSASVAAAGVVGEYVTFGMRYHTKRSFTGGSDALKKVG